MLSKCPITEIKKKVKIVESKVSVGIATWNTMWLLKQWELFSNGQCDCVLVLEHCTRKTMSDMVQEGNIVLPQNIY